MVGEDTPVTPDSHYGISKYISEEIVASCVERWNILRICGIYGLDGPAHLGLNAAIGNALRKQEAPTLKGAGQGKRNYICVSDVAEWLCRLLLHRAEREEHVRETLYVAGPEILSIREYLETIVDVLLPGKRVRQEEGGDSRDMVVVSSPPPMPLTTFADYLKSLGDKVESHD
jgi:nucleoside-diphosphate-sugar epimerase